MKGVLGGDRTSNVSSDSTHPVRDAVEHSDAISLDLLETPLDPRVVRRDEVWNRLDREPARLDIDHPALDELLDEIGAHVLRGWTTG